MGATRTIRSHQNYRAPRKLSRAPTRGTQRAGEPGSQRSSWRRTRTPGTAAGCATSVAHGRSTVEPCPLAVSSQTLHRRNGRVTRSAGKDGSPASTTTSPPHSGPTSSLPGVDAPIAKHRARPSSGTASCRYLVAAGTRSRTWFPRARRATRASTTTKSRGGFVVSVSTSAHSCSGTRPSCPLFALRIRPHPLGRWMRLADST
jgi:hypothetical protein